MTLNMIYAVEWLARAATNASWARAYISSGDAEMVSMHATAAARNGRTALIYLAGCNPEEIKALRDTHILKLSQNCNI